MGRDLDKAVSSIAKGFDLVAAATYADGRGLLVVIRSDVTSRAMRSIRVRDAMGRHGRDVEIAVYTPEEVAELRDDPGCDLGAILATCTVVRGSLDGLRR